LFLVDISKSDVGPPTKIKNNTYAASTFIFWIDTNFNFFARKHRKDDILRVICPLPR
jgi:hypothetical protein